MPPRHRGPARTEGEVNDTDARLWHPWLRINRVLRAMLHTRWSAEVLAAGQGRVQEGPCAEESDPTRRLVQLTSVARRPEKKPARWWRGGGVAARCARAAAAMPVIGFLSAVSPGPFAQRVAVLLRMFTRGDGPRGFGTWRESEEAGRFLKGRRAFCAA